MIAVFVLTRLVTTAFLLHFAHYQHQNAWTTASPNYFEFASLWDGHWYRIVAAVGYPSELPLAADGIHVGESAWAFMPAYPALVRMLMVVTGGGWNEISVLVSVGFALGASLVLYQLMLQVLGSPPTALFAVVLFLVAPVSPIFQVAYAESMYAFLLALALLLSIRRHYLALVPVIAVMALTRPSGLAFALYLGLYGIYRFVIRRRESLSVREGVTIAALAVYSAIMGFAWLLIAGLVTGELFAYLETELAWRSAYVGYGELIPFTPWFIAGNWWIAPPWGALLVAGLVLSFGVSLFLPATRRLGVPLRLWLLSYALYLLAVFFPQSSTFRLLMPMFPLVGALATPTSRWYRISIVMISLVLQWWWIHHMWAVDDYDWTPP